LGRWGVGALELHFSISPMLHFSSAQVKNLSGVKTYVTVHYYTVKFVLITVARSVRSPGIDDLTDHPTTLRVIDSERSETSAL